MVQAAQQAALRTSRVPPDPELERDPNVDHTKAILERIPEDEDWTGVEIGVFRAANASRLLAARPRLTLYLVDRWVEYTDQERQDYAAQSSARPSHKGHPRFNQEDWRRVFKKAMDTLRPHWGRIVILPMVQERAVSLVPDVDFVFVDDMHTYDGCKSSINLWMLKCRQWIGGHDYSSLFPGVCNAVCDSFDDFELGKGTTWFKSLHTGKDRSPQPAS